MSKASRPKPPASAAPAPFERALDVISSTLIEVLVQQKHILEGLGELMSSIDDLNKAEQQLTADVSSQGADIQALTDATSKQLVNLQQQIAALKQQQPALDLTTLNSAILALEANHKKMIDLTANIAGTNAASDASSATASVTPVQPDPDNTPDPAAAPTSAPPASPADPNSAGETVNLSAVDPGMDVANPSHS